MLFMKNMHKKSTDYVSRLIMHECEICSLLTYLNVTKCLLLWRVQNIESVHFYFLGIVSP